MRNPHGLIEYLIHRCWRSRQQFTQGRLSPGVLLVRQDLPVGEAIETLLLIWEASDADESVKSTLPGAKLGHDCNRWLCISNTG